MIEMKNTVELPEEKRKENKELSLPADFTSPEQLYAKLIETMQAYHTATDLSLVEKAYRLAHKASHEVIHEESRREQKYSLYVALRHMEDTCVCTE